MSKGQVLGNFVKNIVVYIISCIIGETKLWRWQWIISMAFLFISNDEFLVYGRRTFLHLYCKFCIYFESLVYSVAWKEDLWRTEIRLIFYLLFPRSILAVLINSESNFHLKFVIFLGGEKLKYVDICKNMSFGRKDLIDFGVGQLCHSCVYNYNPLIDPRISKCKIFQIISKTLSYCFLLS